MTIEGSETEGLPELSGVQKVRPDAARLEELGSGGRLDDAATSLDILDDMVGRFGPPLEDLSIEQLRHQTDLGGSR